jgi:hypothetical protein
VAVAAVTVTVVASLKRNSPIQQSVASSNVVMRERERSIASSKRKPNGMWEEKWKNGE